MNRLCNIPKRCVGIMLIGSMVGAFTGLITLFIVPNENEVIVWLLLMVVLSWICKKLFKKKLLLKTFLFSLIVGINITLTHLVFVKTYLSSHQSEIAGLDAIKIGGSYRLTLIVIAPVYWISLGALSVFLVWVISKSIKR